MKLTIKYVKSVDIQVEDEFCDVNCAYCRAYSLGENPTCRLFGKYLQIDTKKLQRGYITAYRCKECLEAEVVG